MKNTGVVPRVRMLLLLPLRESDKEENAREQKDMSNFSQAPSGTNQHRKKQGAANCKERGRNLSHVAVCDFNASREDKR